MICRNASKKIAISLATLVALTVSFFLSVPFHAQVGGATPSGTVTDVAGFYSAPNLLPALHEVAPGFSTRVQTGITSIVGAQQVLNSSLQVGQVTL